jgi:predicted RNA binding protein YcfA (HicA-like mRNA interferase family)
MARLPRPSGQQMVRFLELQGFTVVRVRGSHHVMARDTQRTSIPVHGNRALKIGTLRGILRDIDMSPDEFERLWDER